ncbi:hypothetical protein RZN25_11165 [Bacillaceae bacterium S4-13-56]
MAFGVNRKELQQWKESIVNGEIAFLTHYWIDDRFPDCNTVTKVGARSIEELEKWGKKYGLKSYMIDRHPEFPHYDLFGDWQLKILRAEGKTEQIKRFRLG